MTLLLEGRARPLILALGGRPEEPEEKAFQAGCALGDLQDLHGKAGKVAPQGLPRTQEEEAVLGLREPPGPQGPRQGLSLGLREAQAVPLPRPLPEEGPGGALPQHLPPVKDVAR